MKEDQRRPNRVEEEVVKTLASLDQLGTIDTGPYFRTRLEARLAESKTVQEPWLAKLLLGPRLAPLFFALVIAVNGLTVWAVLKSPDSESAKQAQSGFEAVAEQYLLPSSGLAVDVESE